MSYSWGVGVGSVRTESLPVVGPAAEAPVDGPSPSRPGDLVRLAAELAPMVNVWQSLLALHVPDRAGRCTTCTKGGTGLPSMPWPCSIHGIADLARRRHDDTMQQRSA